jgi:asparagine synthase (glutamine-hydrolysing)
MCGIAGVIAWEDRYRTSRQTLARLSARIAHRGPDGEGLYLNHEQQITPDRPQVALAHRRLAIIDLDPRANQPFTDHQGRHLVFNGEIYNYRELRAELTHLNPAYPWRTTSDTEVLLAAYAHWGENCLQHLNGMFAFAIWDEEKKELFLARDRMGQKPLYYASLSSEPSEVDAQTSAGHWRPLQVVAFASEIDAIRALPWVSSEINHVSLAHYLAWGYVSHQGMYKGVEQLYPGSRRLLTGQRMKDTVFFQHSIRSPREKQWELLSDAERVRETRHLVEQAVSAQLVADVPIGCFLSGGIDSSVVAASMARSVGDPRRVHTFSIGFDDPRYDETSYAAAVAKHLGTTHRQFTVRPDAATDLPKLAEVFGEPFGDSSALPTHYLSRETRQHVKVALSGDGGDELFGGYDRYRAVTIANRLDTLPRFVRAVLTSRLGRLVVNALPGTHPKSRITRLKRFLATLDQNPATRYVSYLRLFDEQLLSGLWPGLHSFHLYKTRHEYTFSGYLDQRDAVAAALACDRTHYLPGDLLTKLDRASMLHALEVRSPFMDHNLVRFASTLRSDQLLKGGPKRMLREAFAADLPDFVFKRRKMGFAVPIGEWFRAELRPMLHDHLFAADSFASEHFHRPTLQRLIDEHEQFHIDHSQRLYALLMLELWWRLHKSGG